MSDDKFHSSLHIGHISMATITVPPMFPANVHVGGASIQLHADGSWSGDRDAFVAALKEAKQITDDVAMPLLWLVANAISRD